jgi:glycosyltransferase involved in cell wall biosynthesis
MLPEESTDQSAPQSVAFTLPCLNEAKTIEWCVTRALEAVAILSDRHGLQGEVIVADNGSVDGSQDLARAAGARVVDVADRGYGAALIGGFAASDATYLVMGDSDCSYDFVEAVEMVESLMDGADFCMGSRFKGEIKPSAMPWKNRYIGNPILSGVLKLLFGTNISDSHCGMRAIRREAYLRIKPSSTGMEFASEMVLKAVLRGLKLDEVPITLSPDQRDRAPHLNPWRDGLRHLIYMFLLSPKHLFLWPAAIMLIIGVAIFAVLLSSGDASNAQIAGFRFGNHWAVVASGLIAVSVQVAIMGVVAVIYSYQQGFRTPSTKAMGFLRHSRLERWLLGGFVLIAIGLIWAIKITAAWIASDYGPLNEMRSLLGAATFIVAGFQVFFAGFLLSVLSGNRASHISAI